MKKKREKIKAFMSSATKIILYESRHLLSVETTAQWSCEIVNKLLIQKWKVSWELCCFKETKLSFPKAWCDRPIHLNCMEPVLLLKSWDLGCVGCIVHIWVCISPSCKLLCQVRTLLGALQKQWLMFCLKGSTSDQLLPFLLALWCQVCPQHVWRAGWDQSYLQHNLLA